MSQNALSRNVNGNGKVILDTHPESDQHQNQTSSRDSPPAPTHQIWWWSMNLFLRYLADKQSAHRHTDTQTDTRRWPQDLAAYGAQVTSCNQIYATGMLLARRATPAYTWFVQAAKLLLMTRITDMGGDHQADSSGWLFKSPLTGGGGHIVAAPLQTARLIG